MPTSCGERSLRRANERWVGDTTELSIPGGRPFLATISRRGNCYDNAAMESWFSTLKNEMGEVFESPHDVKVKLFDYIEVFYSQQRMYSAIGYAAPAEFERAAA